jgi:DNA repair exonuclease SbcCD ATPase subunit
MLDALPSREVLEADRAAWDKLHALDVSNALEWLEELEERAAEKPPAIDFALLDLDSQLSDLWDAEKVNRAAAKEAREATAKARADWKAAEEQRRRVEDLKQAGKCPTCGQATDTPHVHDSAIHLGEEVAGLAADGGKYSRAQAAIEAEGDRIAADIRQAQEARANAQARRDAARQSYERTKRDLDLAAEKAERLIAEDNPHDAALAGMLEKRAAWGKIVTDAQQDKDDHEAAALHFEFWQKNFKAVRLYQVQQILAQFELEVANAASVLGLVGWRISFATETETKGRTIKQGIQVRIESPTAEGPWEAWSGGEGQRIRLAVAIGLASLIHARAGVQFGFEVWDEPSAWLSPEGIEDLLECLKYRAQITGKSVWLLDHRALVHSGFAEMWQATKTSAGTQLERLR